MICTQKPCEAWFPVAVLLNDWDLQMMVRVCRLLLKNVLKSRHFSFLWRFLVFINVYTHIMLRNLIITYTRFLPNSIDAIWLESMWRFMCRCFWFLIKAGVKKKKKKSEFLSLDCILAISFIVQKLENKVL